MPAARPNLFVIGAAKSGTTSLHHYLSRHPEIHMSDPKEPGFFVDELDYYPSDEEWYLNLFSKGAELRYRGESSTHYTKLPVYPGVPERIAAFCEDPRFLYLMRDPVERAISQYWHNVRKKGEFRSPVEAMRENVEYKAFGEYDRQLRPYLKHFGRNRMYVFTFEEFVSDPAGSMSEIFAWLSLEQPPDDPDYPAKNRAPSSVDQFLLGQTLGEFFFQSETWDFLSPFIPKAWKDLVKQRTTKGIVPTDHPMDEVVQYLRPWAERVVDRTSVLLEREFPEWSLSAKETR